MIGGHAVAQQSQFDEANSLLAEGKYQQAIQTYQSIVEDGHLSGALWQNLGIAYTRLDSLGKAEYYFLQAEKFEETEEQATRALQYVNNQFPRQSAVLPELPWIRFFNFLSDSFGVAAITFTALFFLYAGIAFKIGAWFRFDLRRTFNYVSYAAIVFSILLFFCSVFIQYQQNNYSTGVMIGREATVHEQPRPESSVISTAYEGYTMQVDNNESEQQKDWTYIRLENGMYGWIQSDQIMTF